ncbi:MAG: acyl-CoA dehydrogenase family protein [Oscillatoriales cyanobacterium C42_A2020_001]|nr:acyl-CoA dehydrogenase family protein [Leptolyngbyaceae cyanobacterium C42_A2020_001]
MIEIQTNTDYLAIAKTLAAEFGTTAIERDRIGGTPRQERDRIRESGLLKLIIPTTYGGIGENWITTFKISRELAKTDSSISHIYSYHNLSVIIAHLLGSPEQKHYFYTETVRQNWFWCNALNPLDRRTFLSREEDHFRLNGVKSFCSGSKDSDILPITATHKETGDFLVLAIPTRRAGIIIQDDWDNIGQRQTDSGSIKFENVIVYPDEIFSNRSRNQKPFSTFRSLLTQLNLANIYLGIAQGAFEAAKGYTLPSSRPWLTSGVSSASEDPYILRHYGELWVALQSAEALADKAAEIVQTAWQQEWDLSAKLRGECAIAIATAKVAATRTGLDVTNRIFEVMGTRSTHSQYGFDRYWRNLRTFTLHDPLDYKLQDIGNWALNNEFPQPNFYS